MDENKVVRLVPPTPENIRVRHVIIQGGTYLSLEDLLLWLYPAANTTVYVGWIIDQLENHR